MSAASTPKGSAAVAAVISKLPRVLDRLSQENNALSPCIEAMVTNIDGTGYIFEKDTDNRLEQDPTDPQVQALNDFFNEPWPGENFMSIRKKVRRDVERTGNGYIEVIRTPNDQIVYLRHVDAKMMRIVKLDEPTITQKTVQRKGVAVKIKTSVRERRYCQLLNGIALVYFKEFGASRDLNKRNGAWAPQGQRLPANLRSSEILHLTALPDAHTPYGVPRWVSQMPSVLGSRKGEEFNLDFFDNGGVPPLLILLQGGTLAAETRRALEQGLQAGAKRANRVQILEAEPLGGAIDSPSTAKITIERFGHDPPGRLDVREIRRQVRGAGAGAGLSLAADLRGGGEGLFVCQRVCPVHQSLRGPGVPACWR